MAHICDSRLTITGSDNGLSPGQRQAIIWTNDGILLIGPLGTNFSENLIEILTFSFKKIRLKVSFVKWRPFCLDLNMLDVTTKIWFTYWFVFIHLYNPVCNKQWCSKKQGTHFTTDFVAIFKIQEKFYFAAFPFLAIRSCQFLQLPLQLCCCRRSKSLQ